MGHPRTLPGAPPSPVGREEGPDGGHRVTGERGVTATPGADVQRLGPDAGEVGKSPDDTWREPYVTTARAKGLQHRVIQARHAFRNAALPALTILGLLAGATVTNAVVAETVFSRDGVGRLAQEAVLAQDVPVVQAIVIVAAGVFVLVNLAVDLIYPLLDPRVARTAAVT